MLLATHSVLAFDYETVVARAQGLATVPFKPPQQTPQALRQLNYDQYRDIRLRPEKTLWSSTRKRHFDMQPLHVGSIFNYPVQINIIDREGMHRLDYSSADFSFGQNPVPQGLPEDLGFAGFRVRYPINRDSIQDEVVVFAGASYFRAVSKGTLYGLSARGLAIDTASERGEEFPIFREFWLERPAAGDTAMRLYALLDSKRITGAYRFVIYPGETTRMRIEATLFPRAKIDEVGIAPLTSMFFIGKNSYRPDYEWRPEIHDSDGLLLLDGTGEWIWRPLDNQKALRISLFELNHPKGFGLLQRDRRYASYDDLETHMERRPSAWIEPIGDWGKGHVKLTEIPTNNEYNDNVVMYWVADQALPPQEPFNYAYWLNWNAKGPQTDRVAQVYATRTARNFEEKTRRFVVDFSGAGLAELPDNEPIKARIWTDDNSRLERYHVSRNPEIGGARLSFLLSKDNKQRSELRAQLVKDNEVVSETWSYLLEN